MRSLRCSIGLLKLGVLTLLLSTILTGCGSNKIIYEQPGTGGYLASDTSATVSAPGADGKLVTGKTILPAGTKVLVPDNRNPALAAKPKPAPVIDPAPAPKAVVLPEPK